MNPYHVWLGLSESTANPNHYQLLGIKSSERDVKVIEQAARIRLKQLKQVTPDQGQTSSLEQLKNRVRRAHRILSDSEMRAEYDKKLSAKLRDVRKQKKRGAAEGDQVTLSKKSSESKHPRSEHSISEPPIAPRTSDQSGSFDPPAIPSAIALPIGNPQAADSNLPTASAEIPMAVPIPDRDSSRDGPVEALTNPQAFSFENKAKDPFDVSVKLAKYRRKKRSYLIPIFGLVLCVVGIIALTFVVINMDDRKNLSAEGETPTKSVESSLFDQKDRGKATTVDSDEMVERRSPKDADDASASANPGESKLVPSDDLPNLVSLSFEELVRVRRHLEQAHRSLYRGDAQTAQNELENAQSMFARFETNTAISLDPSQHDVRDAAYSVTKIKSLVDGFWRQVTSSAVKIAGGQPIRVADSEHGFVEGTEEFVVLRVDGTNRTYYYPNVPPGIAMALGEQGEKADVPTWRMQQAAFYAIHSHIDSRYRTRALELCEMARQDFHDPTPIIKYLDFDRGSIGVPETKSESLDPAEVKKLLPIALGRLKLHDYKSFRPEQAEKAIDTVLSAAVLEKNPKHQAIDFEVAYNLAIKSGNARQIADVLDEYFLWVDIDRGEKLCQALLSVSQAKLDEAKARYLLTEIAKSAPSISDQGLKQQLIENGKKVREKFGLENLTNVLDRL